MLFSLSVHTILIYMIGRMPPLVVPTTALPIVTLLCFLQHRWLAPGFRFRMPSHPMHRFVASQCCHDRSYARAMCDRTKRA